MDDTKENQKRSFWVIKDNKPQFVEGELRPESEDDWCPGEIRFHDIDGKHYYLFWADTAEEVIKEEIKSEEIGFRVEKELLESELEYLEAETKEKIQYWTDMLKNLCKSCKCPKEKHFGDGCYGPEDRLGGCSCWGFEEPFDRSPHRRNEL